MADGQEDLGVAPCLLRIAEELDQTGAALGPDALRLFFRQPLVVPHAHEVLGLRNRQRPLRERRRGHEHAHEKQEEEGAGAGLRA